MDLKIGNFRASYLDFRPLADLRSKGPSAHIESDYARHAINAFLDIGRFENGAGPDVVHLELPTFQFGDEGEYTGVIRSWLGAEWSGQFLVSVGKMPSNLYATVAERSWYERPGLFDWIDGHRSVRVDVVDETSLAAAAIHETIKVARAENMHENAWSSHYHRPCSESGMRVCSPVCDSTAQQVLNVAFRSKDPAPWRLIKRRDRCVHAQRDHNAAASREFQFCLRCPKELVPFTMLSPKIATVCRNHVPLSRST